MKIGIIAAMASEREQLARLVEGMRTERHGLFEYTIGQLGGNTLYIMECGIGKVNAAVGASELMARMQPDVVVSTGVAGGIDAKAGVMEVVAASEVVYHDVWCGMGNAYGQIQGLPPRFTCDERLVRKAVSLPSSVPVHAGLICTGDKFITERGELDAIKAEFPEGLGRRHGTACHSAGLPPLPRAFHQFPDYQRHAGSRCALAAVREFLGNDGRPFFRGSTYLLGEFAFFFVLIRKNI